ncbi:hypothetical protein KAR10_05915, partial [bacterium]|nr:hypothetical protein [bacterium]
MSYYFAADLINLLPLNISGGSVLKTIGLAGLTGFFDFWYLSFNYTDLARIFFLVFGLSFLRLPQLVRTLRGFWTQAGMVRPEDLYLGWDKFTQDESAEVVKDRLDRLIEDWGKNVLAYTPAELEILQETVKEKLTEYDKQLEKTQKSGAFIKYRLGAIGLALFFLLTQVLAVPAYILAYPAIRLRSWESEMTYLNLWLKLGRQFTVSYFHMWVIAAEIGVSVKAGLLLGDIPQLGFVGKFARGIILALEGPEGAISWGEKLFGSLPPEGGAEAVSKPEGLEEDIGLGPEFEKKFEKVREERQSAFQAWEQDPQDADKYKKYNDLCEEQVGMLEVWVKEARWDKKARSDIADKVYPDDSQARELFLKTNVVVAGHKNTAELELVVEMNWYFKELYGTRPGQVTFFTWRDDPLDEEFTQSDNAIVLSRNELNPLIEAFAKDQQGLVAWNELRRLVFRDWEKDQGDRDKLYFYARVCEGQVSKTRDLERDRELAEQLGLTDIYSQDLFIQYGVLVDGKAGQAEVHSVEAMLQTLPDEMMNKIRFVTWTEEPMDAREKAETGYLVFETQLLLLPRADAQAPFVPMENLLQSLWDLEFGRHNKYSWYYKYQEEAEAQDAFYRIYQERYQAVLENQCQDDKATRISDYQGGHWLLPVRGQWISVIGSYSTEEMAAYYNACLR